MMPQQWGRRCGAVICSGGMMRGKDVMRLILALTVLVSVILRPPGTMLTLDGDTITYELCTAEGYVNLTVAVDGEAGETLDLGCDFFAAQIAALPYALPDVVPVAFAVTRFSAPVTSQTNAGPADWRHYTPRAPPHVS